MGVLQARLHVLARELRISGEEVRQVRVVRQIREYPLHGDARALHDGLAHHDSRVLDDAFVIQRVFFSP